MRSFLKTIILVSPLLFVPFYLTPASANSTVSQIAQGNRCEDENIEIRARNSRNIEFERGKSWTVCNYILAFRGDGNLVLYKKSDRTVLWATGTRADIFAVQDDGNVVLYENGEPVWATNTDGNRRAIFAIQTDGNVVVYTSNGQQPIFATNTDGGQYQTRTAARDWSGGRNRNSSQRLTFPLERYNSIHPNCLFGGSCDGSGIHVGVDYMVSAGTVVRSICDGKVIYLTSNGIPIRNRVTIIKHKNCGGYNTLYSYYGHINSQVNQGDDVSQGQVIGTIGEWPTNLGDNSHLHFGLSTKMFSSNWGYRNNQQDIGYWIDPQSFF